ncbi:MAG TPA: hypothetical protein VGB87_16775, partial [Vicinamibacteria bacterium]
MRVDTRTADVLPTLRRRPPGRLRPIGPHSTEFLHGLERVAADIGTANHMREDAIRLLLSLAPDRGWPRVAALLDSPEAAARRRGLFLEASQPGGLGPAAIARALADPEPEVQEVALGLALGAGM